MPNTYRNESRRRPPLEKYGTPGTQYPTANPYDLVITEEVTHRAQAFEPVLFGTPHPTVTTAVLCWQGQIKGNNTDKAPVRIYATPRLAQEPYNLTNGGDEASDSACPTFVRSYLLPRGYVSPAYGQPLTALIGLTLVSGGSGYGAALDTPGYGKVALNISGGSGAGAAGFAEVAGGVVVAVVLTQSGSGYTGTPTVSLAGSGTGASITALRQPASAVLVSETEEPAEDPYGGWFVRVTRTYETLPGPILESFPLDEQTGLVVRVRKQFVARSQATAANAGIHDDAITPSINEYIEFRDSGNVNKSIKISSAVVALPGTLAWNGTAPLSLPDTLLGVTAVYEKSETSGATTNGGSPKSVSGSVAAHVAGNVIVNTIDGFRGEARAAFTRTWSRTAPAAEDLPAVTNILPTTGTVYIKSRGFSKSQAVGECGGSFSGGTRSNVRAIKIGPVLTNGVSLSGGSSDFQVSQIEAASPGEGIYPTVNIAVTAVSSVALSLPVSSPPAVTSGASITGRVEVEMWRLGIFVTTKTVITVP